MLHDLLEELRRLLGLPEELDEALRTRRARMKRARCSKMRGASKRKGRKVRRAFRSYARGGK
jgi:hypothetical protein